MKNTTHKAKKSLGLKPVGFVRAKKALGQNFLKSSLALKIIIEAGEINLNKDIILEIGPGKGVLTEKLLEKAKKVIAVEKDSDLVALLKEKFAEQIKKKKLILVEEDILEFNTSAYGLKPKAYKIIANIPYNITGAILKKFLSEIHQPTLMVLMVQNEVAKRIIGRGKNPSTPLRVKESILSISVKAYGEPKMIMKVPARYFSPAPKVDSAVLQIKNISKKFFTSPKTPSPLQGHSPLSGGDRRPAQINNLSNRIFEEKFWELIHAGFAHKRKKLSNNLKKVVKNLPEEYKDKRAEDLSLADWQKILKNNI